jgi:class 3 adenylate cyclase/tetratricopeptide (TPR) repeat protein
MKCRKCQHFNRAEAKFCEDCGAPLAGTCANCGHELSPTAKFCPECGRPAVPSKQSSFASPETYMPRHLAEKILSSKAALEGERKQVTVLFADLKASMELLADRDPEEARKLLDPVLERMMEAVHRYEGTVSLVMGDGIMAIFGAPIAHEDHAIRACYAALRMQKQVKRHAADARNAFGVNVQIRVGLNSGEVIVGTIGSDLRMGYTAVGRTTHLAARMEQMARLGTILLAPHTMALAEGFVQVMPRGPAPVKGLATPIEIFELVGANPVRSRLHVAASRGLTRFVGREAEMELLRQAFGQAGEGHGQVVAIVGEPGVGKSRLVWEFTHSHRSHAWLVLTTASMSYAKATTYFPVIELLRTYFGIEPRDDDRKICEKVIGKLLSLDQALEPVVPVFHALLDMPTSDVRWTKLDPLQRRRQTLDALKRLVLRETQVQPVVLVVEDLHWIDSETQAWLDLLVESSPTARFLLLVSYRPEYQHGWMSKTYYSHVRLDALQGANAEKLVENLLGTDPGLQDLRRLLIDRTQSNPFFLEETVRSLVETQALTGERGAYRLARPVQSIRLPTTVQAILAARIDRLVPGDKQLLQIASVIGTDVPFPLLEVIAEGHEEHLSDRLARLQAAEFLYEAQLFPELEYTFKHALTHEVAYGSLPHDRRRSLHAQIVKAIEEVYANRQAEQVDRLAYHAVRAEMWDRAVTYSRQIAEKACSRLANREAVVHLEQAFSALQHLPESRQRQEQAVDIRLELVAPLFQLGDLARRERYLCEAQTLVSVLGDQRRDALVSRSLSHHFWIRGDQDQALQFGERAVAAGSALADSGREVLATIPLGMVHYITGNFRLAVDLFTSTLDLLDRESEADKAGRGVHRFLTGAGNVRVWLACTHSELGEFAVAARIAQEALRMAETANNAWWLVHAYYAIGFQRVLQGDFADAIQPLDRGVHLSLNLDIPFSFPLIAPVLGAAYALAGKPHDGIPLLEKACDFGASRGIGNLQARRVCWLAEAYLLADQVEDGMRLAQQALQLAKNHNEAPNEARAHRLMGEIAIYESSGSVGAAEEHFHQGGELARKLGMRPLVAHCHLGLGKLHDRAGNREQAREHLATATTMYREMGMRFYLEQAEAMCCH